MTTSEETTAFVERYQKLLMQYQTEMGKFAMGRGGGNQLHRVNAILEQLMATPELTQRPDLLLNITYTPPGYAIVDKRVVPTRPQAQVMPNAGDNWVRNNWYNAQNDVRQHRLDPNHGPLLRMEDMGDAMQILYGGPPVVDMNHLPRPARERAAAALATEAMTRAPFIARVELEPVEEEVRGRLRRAFDAIIRRNDHE